MWWKNGKESKELVDGGVKDQVDFFFLRKKGPSRLQIYFWWLENERSKIFEKKLFSVNKQHLGVSK